METPPVDDRPISHYTIYTEVGITVAVRNPDAIERVTGPGGDEWRSQFYSLHTAADVLGHWTYNLICNHVSDVSRLEGWADLKPGDVVFESGFTEPSYVGL